MAFEASNWRIKALERRGFDQAAIVDARSAVDAETAYFHGEAFVADPEPVLPAIDLAVSSPALAPGKPVVGGMLGLVGYRGDR